MRLSSTNLFFVSRSPAHRADPTPHGRPGRLTSVLRRVFVGGHGSGGLVVLLDCPVSSLYVKVLDGDRWVRVSPVTATIYRTNSDNGHRAEVETIVRFTSDGPWVVFSEEEGGITVVSCSVPPSFPETGLTAAELRALREVVSPAGVYPGQEVRSRG